LKRYELEAFAKSFIIFFVSLLVLLSISVFFYYKEEIRNIDDNIKHKMWIYNFDFKNPDFGIDFVDKNKTLRLDMLYKTQKEIYMYFPIQELDTQYLKVLYPIKKYNALVKNIQVKTIKIYTLFVLVLFVFSIFYALYALYPLKNAIGMLNEFLKDFIHDLNTPVSSMFINLKLLKRGYKQEVVNRVEMSALSISNLYKNLEYFIKDIKLDKDKIALKSLIEQRVYYFKNIYPQINFKQDLEDLTIVTNKEMIERIVDNLISNACKYNKKPNIVTIILKNDILTIKDSGIGIKNPNKVFERYYKEGARGLGIGLHIVKKLCDELNIKITLDTKIDEGTSFYLDLKKVKL